MTMTMKTKYKLPVLCIALGLLFSCKKEQQFITTKDNVSHPWKLQQQGLDKNGNGKFDLEEKNPVVDSAKVTYQFKSDFTGYIVGVNSSFVDTMKWDLRENETQIYIEVLNQGFVNKRTYLFEYSAKTLILRDTSYDPDYFMYLERMD